MMNPCPGCLGDGVIDLINDETGYSEPVPCPLCHGSGIDPTRQQEEVEEQEPSGPARIIHIEEAYKAIDIRKVGG